MKRRFRSFGTSTFRSLKVRNYRLYFVAQVISVSGTWMQTVAQAWLVLHLAPPGEQGVDLGVVTALQFLPMLLFGTYGGLVADRLDKRRLLYATQSSAGMLALALGLLTSLGVVRLWEVFALATLLGFVNMIDNPARQTFVLEMVGRDDLPNAVSLNSVVMNSARVIGPAIGGLIIALVGLAPCFEINAASYAAVIVGLSLMRRTDLHRSEPVPRARGQLRQGLRYAWRTPALRDPLLLVAVVGTLAYNFQVLLALLAKLTFHGGAGTYSALTSLMGGGAVLGGLVVAGRNRPDTHRLTSIGMGFGALILGVALSPSLPVALAVIFPMGALSIAFIATANAALQLRADPAMRGRVMALYAIGFLGTTPIGSPLVGWISQVSSPRVALAVGAVATVVASVVVRVVHQRGHAGRLQPPAAVQTAVGVDEIRHRGHAVVRAPLT
ncbi:MAG TPA: MFS transporter [Acidimicrobiales bacterium]|nr:MFS transporter [Acidimicrobiales bacterium]